MTLEDLKNLKSNNSEIDPDKIEVIPPDGDDDKGLTKKEIEAINTGRRHIDPEEVEVIPPESDQERGLTLEMLKQKIRSDQQSSSSIIVP